MREPSLARAVRYAGGSGPDPLLSRRLQQDRRASPSFQPQWTVRKGVEQLYEAFKEHGLEEADLSGWRFQRIARIGSLLEAGRLSPDLRWRTA